MARSHSSRMIRAQSNVLRGVSVNGSAEIAWTALKHSSIAARRIAGGERILKYDTVIGVAARDIEPGDYVHAHNMKLADFERDPAFGQDVRAVDYLPEAERASFMGFVRADGRVGTRNFIGILSSVNCSATVIKAIAAHFTTARLTCRFYRLYSARC